MNRTRPRWRFRTLRIRFSLRQMMTAVGGIAVALGLAAFFASSGRRSLEYGAMRDRYGQRANDCYVTRLASASATVPGRAELVARLKERERYFMALHRKYARAAACPWLPVLPDPPEPE